MTSRAEEIIEQGLSDYSVHSLSWSNDGCDLTVDLSKPGITGDSQPLDDQEDGIGLQFLWATNVRIDLKFGELAGCPLLYESGLEALEGGRKRVTFDFDGVPNGYIQLECNDIVLKPSVR